MVETLRKLLWKHIYVTCGINHCSLHVCKPKPNEHCAFKYSGVTYIIGCVPLNRHDLSLIA